METRKKKKKRERERVGEREGRSESEEAFAAVKKKGKSSEHSLLVRRSSGGFRVFFSGAAISDML